MDFSLESNEKLKENEEEEASRENSDENEEDAYREDSDGIQIRI